MTQKHASNAQQNGKWLWAELLALLIIAVSGGISQSGHAEAADEADEAEIVFDEKKVKRSVEEMAVIYICSDQMVLESAGIDVNRCTFDVALFSESCCGIRCRCSLVHLFPLPAHLVVAAG
jgi:hypothetical protein